MTRRNLLFLLISSFFAQCYSKNIVIIQSNDAISEISEHFIGVTIDTFALPHWHDSFFRSKQVMTLAKALAPLFIRMGGTSADHTIFSLKEELGTKGNGMQFDTDHKKSEFPVRLKRFDGSTREFEFKNFTMTASLWDKVNLFVKEAGWDFIFDLNSLQRFGNGSWDMNNAVQLMKYTSSKGYKLAGWELGNEPNVYKGTNVVSPSQLSEDYFRLRNIIQELFPNSFLIGPSVTNLVGKTVDYFVNFLKGPGSKAINASTFHHYYGFEGNFNLLDFMNPKILDNLIPEIAIARKYTTEYCPGKQVWIGETSSVWGGGKPGYSDRYVAGFMWLDKLGLSAKLGVDTVIRQDFYGAHYGLLNAEGSPNPDYWLTLLYKLLVGSRVLNTTALDIKTNSSTDHLRFYSHCTNIKGSNYSRGSITVYGMNLNAVDTAVYFDQYIETELHLYLLEPSDNYGLTSSNVSLNGRQLEVTEDGNIPNLLTPVVVRNPVIIPGFRFGFIVIPSANTKICY